MKKYKLQKFGVNYLNIVVAFEGSTEDEVNEMIHTFDFGTLRLVKGAKVLELDAVNPVAEGFTIVLQVEEYDGAMEDEVDVIGDLDEATLFIGDRFEIEPDYITLFVNKGECNKAIDLDIDGREDTESLGVVYYKGKKYYTREITAVGKDFKVGTHSLAHVLDEDYEQGEDSEEFISLSDILLFVPDDLIVATDRALLEYFLGRYYEGKL